MNYFDNAPYLEQFAALPAADTTASETPVVLCLLAGSIVVVAALAIRYQQILLQEQEARIALLHRKGRPCPFARRVL